MKHIILLSASFFGVFFAFNTSQALQTSSHSNPIQGYINLGCLYGMFAFFSFFGPKVVSMLGPKVSMILGAVAYAIVVASNLIDSAVVQILANLLVGVGAAILWNAQGVYLGRCALWDSRTSSKSFAETTSSFNGVFYSIFQFTGCFGTAIGGVIKQLTDDNRVLFTVLTVVGALAVASMFILPSVKAYTAPGHSENEDTVSINATLRLLCKSMKLVMTLPIVIYNGMSLAYIFGDLTNSVYKPAFGASWVLYLTAIFYGSNSLFSYFFGKCVEKKWMSRSVMCFIAFLTQLLAYLFIIFYHVQENDKSVLDLVLVIAMVVILSAGDAVWESQPPAILQSFYGLDSERNAAMANYKMWQSLGWCAQFVIGAVWAANKYIYMKSIVLLVLLVVGYLFVVYLDKKVAKLDMKKGESAALLAGVSSN